MPKPDLRGLIFTTAGTPRACRSVVEPDDLARLEDALAALPDDADDGEVEAVRASLGLSPRRFGTLLERLRLLH